MNINKQVYIYTEIVPQNTGSGAQIRVFTNISTYVALGYKVEVLLFTTDSKLVLPDYILALPVKFTVIDNYDCKQNYFDMIGYCLGWPKNQVLNWLFPIRKIVKNRLQKKIDNNVNALHHFEYLSIASSTLGFKGDFIYSNHDCVSERYLKIKSVRDDLSKGKGLFFRYFKYLQLRRAEKWIITTNKVVLTVSDHDTRVYNDRIRKGNIKLLPWSLPDESAPYRSRKWLENNKIKILHLGSLNSMIPYSSLEFILNDLFTILPEDTMDSIELFIAGHAPDAPFSNKIKSLAKKYDNVQILGFVDDIKPLFSTCDLQIVGSQFSTGIRTRIIESFVRGLPVISTNVAAVGICGLENKKNIFLIDTPKQIKNIFSNILSGQEELDIIAKNARVLYEKQYSKKMQTRKLEEYIIQYIN